MKKRVFKQLVIAGSLAAAQQGLAQLSTPVSYSSDFPGIYGVGWQYVTETTHTSGNFLNLNLKVDGPTVYLTADYTFDFSVVIGTGGPGDVTVTVTDVVLRLSGTGITTPVEFKLVEPGDPLTTVVLNVDFTPVSGQLAKSGSFSTTLNPVPADGLYTLEWAAKFTNPPTSEGKSPTFSFAEQEISGGLVIPEPGTYALLAGLGLAAFAAYRRRSV
jgi:hypothetical protein